MMSGGLLGTCKDVWLEPVAGKTKLRVILNERIRTSKFHCMLDLGFEPLRLTFNHVGVFKGQDVFEATQYCPECVSAPPPQGLSLRLLGPLLGGLSSAP
ncbi:hypothetical protein DmGdi_31510 [Gluconobacter sp. Gdi]|nr:hypothetical protein DmGdi_31510 [Gluconobacter sp. Gdi]